MRLPSLFRRAPSGRAADRDAADPSFSRSGPSASSAASPTATSEETIAALRTRARRRLIGATVLVAVAVVSLPWLFESQPRALPADLPIEMARKDGPVAVPDAHGVDRGAAPRVAGDGDAPPPVGARPSSASDTPPAPVRDEPAPKPVSPRPPHPAPTPPTGATTASPTVAAPDAARALALLDGKSAAPSVSVSAGLRYIVQIGAFAESDAVTSARGKAERLGLKTYTQVIDAPAGKRTRVRVGPYASKAEAEHAVSQLRTAGLVAVVLTL